MQRIASFKRRTAARYILVEDVRAATKASRARRRIVLPADKQALIEKIEALPAERIAEVEDFVDFIATKARRLQALDRVLAIAPALEAASAPPMTEERIAAEVRAARSARRSRNAGADRS